MELENMTIYHQCIAAGAAGLASHLIFARGEYHLKAPALFRVYLLLAMLICVSEYRLDGQKLGRAIINTWAVSLSYCIPLFTSIGTYRASFHPLSKIPGPQLARVSSFWHVIQCRESKNHLLIERLHRQYGAVVRTGLSSSQ